MCTHEVIGDFYRGCGHFHGRYFTGAKTDCQSTTCRSSEMHQHKTARKCTCSEIVAEERKVQNMFQIPHVDCQPRNTR